MNSPLRALVCHPHRDTGTGRVYDRLLLGSPRPVSLVMHPGADAEQRVDRLWQAHQMQVSQPVFKNRDTGHRPACPPLSDLSGLITSKGMQNGYP